jgi:Flp pilus assembly protein TadG
MRPPAIFHRPRCAAHRPAERGVTMVLVALAMVAIIAMAALSIDVVTLYLASAEAQRSADAAALAAARVLSITGMTGDTNNTFWGSVCGGAASPASQIAKAVATQNTVSGASPNPVTVMYSAAGDSGQPDCSGLGPAFAVNPTVTVSVRRSDLPTFFSRIWSRTANTVSAAATAEAFNPSNSGNVGNSGSSGTIIPVQPHCVKPWIVPNREPGLGATSCSGPTCPAFVNSANGSIQNPGIQLAGGGTAVIGEPFRLIPDCQPSSASCTTFPMPPIANRLPGPPNLDYLPGAAPASTPTALPSCSVAGSAYEQAIAGCDQSTVYQCGVNSAVSANPNRVDLTENPGLFTGDSSNGVQCLIHESLGSGQDTLDNSSFPFQIQAGSNNPLGLGTGQVITSSSSIASLPIYDDTIPITANGNVTIVGFLQVFIKTVDPSGNIDVVVMNVVGCGNGTPPAGNPVTGTSPVPVRLIQKYP